MPLFNPPDIAPERVAISPHFSLAIAAGATTNLNRIRGNNSHPHYVTPRPGRITALSARLTGIASGSTLLIRAAVNDVVSTELTLMLAPGAQSGTVVGEGAVVAAGDRIRLVAITDASWTGTTLEATADAELTLT